MAMDVTYNSQKIIDSLEVTPPVDITYNGSTIATLNAGDTKTLQCNGKVMASDVVIGSKTLNCNGKLMQGDIVVELAGSAPSGETWYFNDTIGKPNGSIVVNFTSNGVAYKAIMEMYAGKFTEPLVYITDGGMQQAVYNYKNSTWYDEAYRTIVLDEPATGDVLAFLESNAVKQ